MRTSPGNVLMVSNYPSETAYAWWLMEQLWITLSEFHNQRGGRAFLAYPQITTVSPTIAAAGIEVHELAIPGTSTAGKKDVTAFIRGNQIETIYFTDRPWFSIDYARLRWAGVKNILIHDHTPGDRLPITGLRKALKTLRNRLPCVTADYVFCVSPLMRMRNITNGVIPPERCITIQNGIRPLSVPGDRSEVRAKLGIDQDACVVITTGRAHPYKRFDFVVEVARQLITSNPQLKVVFLLVGDGPALDNLQQQVIADGLEEWVKLLGYRRDIHNLLFASDIALHAALGEGFSLSIVEYMSAGLPVVVPDIPSVAQGVQDNVNGNIYSWHQPAAATEHIARLVAAPALRRGMGAAGQRLANQSLTLDRTLTTFRASLAKILSK